MKPEDQLLFLCTRQAFTDDHQERVCSLSKEHTIEWDYVFNMAVSDGVASLVGENIFKLPAHILKISAKDLDHFKKYQISNIFTKKLMEPRMAEVLTYLDQNDIDVLLIKGEALNFMVYRTPWLTTSADIDLVLRPRRKRKFQPGEIEKVLDFTYRYNHKQTGFKQHIEVDFYDHHDINMNGLLPVDFDQLWEDADPINIYGNDIAITTPEDTLMALAINSCRKRFFRLKSLCDIAEVLQTFPALDWQDLVRKAKKYQCNNILWTALYITQSTVGCTLPENLSRDLHVNPIRAALIRALVQALLKSTSLYTLSYHREKIYETRTKKGLSLSLLVTYAAYSWGQLWRKAWSNSDLPSIEE